MIIQNEIPLLEYDDSSSEVIAPDHNRLSTLRRRKQALPYFWINN